MILHSPEASQKSADFWGSSPAAEGPEVQAIAAEAAVPQQLIQPFWTLTLPGTSFGHQCSRNLPTSPSSSQPNLLPLCSHTTK